MGQQNEEEGISSYWVTIRKWKDNENWKRNHYIALSGEVTLEQAMEDRLCDIDDFDDDDDDNDVMPFQKDNTSNSVS